jgi:hypothetical protein
VGRAFLLLLAATLLSSPLQTTPLVGLWDSTSISQGGIGSTLEFRLNGTFVEATTVIVNGYYRVADGRLVIGEQPLAAGATAGTSMAVAVEGDVMRVTAPDGSVVRKDRVGRPEAGKPAIVGAWRYRHYTGTTAFERYTDDGLMFFRLPMKSYVGRYVLKANEIVLTRPSQADVSMTVALRGHELVLSNSGRTTTYRRDSAGPWYERERIGR